MAGVIDMPPASAVAAVHASTGRAATAMGFRLPYFDLRRRPFNRWDREARATVALALRMDRLHARLRSYR